MHMQWDGDLIAAGEEPRYLPKMKKKMEKSRALAAKSQQRSSRPKKVEPAFSFDPLVQPPTEETASDTSDMEVEQSSRVLHSRGTKSSSVKRDTAKKVKKTVSAASLFKRPGKKGDHLEVTSPEERQIIDRFIQAASAAKSTSSVRSPQKVEGRVARKRKRSDMHPLAVAFKDTSDEYRRHLYETTSQKINNTLESLLHRLHESTLQTVATHGGHDDLQASPLRLTAPVKYERIAANLFQPLSQYKLGLFASNRLGERVRIEATLATRMQDYKYHLAQRTEEVARLQKQWEMIVGEIWKLGVTCLGQDAMASLLLSKASEQSVGEFPSDTTKAESTLFVPEHGSPSPVQDGSRGKKHVTFETPHIREGLTDDLAFLSQLSRYKNDTLLAAPPLPEQDVQNMKKEIKRLGKKEMEKLQDIGKEKQQFWKRKANQIMKSLVEE